MVVCFALLAAVANAVASICQRLGVEDAPEQNGPSLGLVRHMVQRKIWLIGFAIMALGYASQAVALHLGSLDVGQSGSRRSPDIDFAVVGGLEQAGDM